MYWLTSTLSSWLSLLNSEIVKIVWLNGYVSFLIKVVIFNYLGKNVTFAYISSNKDKLILEVMPTSCLQLP